MKNKLKILSMIGMALVLILWFLPGLLIIESESDHKGQPDIGLKEVEGEQNSALLLVKQLSPSNLFTYKNKINLNDKGIKQIIVQGIGEATVIKKFELVFENQKLKRLYELEGILAAGEVKKSTFSDLNGKGIKYIQIITGSPSLTARHGKIDIRVKKLLLAQQSSL